MVEDFEDKFILIRKMNNQLRNKLYRALPEELIAALIPQTRTEEPSTICTTQDITTKSNQEDVASRFTQENTARKQTPEDTVTKSILEDTNLQPTKEAIIKLAPKVMSQLQTKAGRPLRQVAKKAHGIHALTTPPNFSFTLMKKKVQLTLTHPSTPHW